MHVTRQGDASPWPRWPRGRDLRFPYPFAQIIALFLLLHLIMSPALITASVPHKVPLNGPKGAVTRGPRDPWHKPGLCLICDR